MRSFHRNDRPAPRRDFGRPGAKRVMHKAVCSQCGQDCEVPFEPIGNKPVFCSECFEKNGRPRRPEFERRIEPRPQNSEQLEAIGRKLDRIIEILSVTSIPIKEEKKVKITKKKTPASKK